jgi:xanthine dehydrogenase iron-sulfur cluster and FAD-binding subunit A
MRVSDALATSHMVGCRMTKTLERALAEVARLPEAEQDRIGRELLAVLERLRAQRSSKKTSPRSLSPADLDELAAFRATMPPAKIDAGTLVSQMRDEDWR